MARKKRKRNYTRTIDLLFLFIFLIVGIVAIYIALSFGILPRKWTMMAAGVLFIIFLIFFITSLKRLPKWVVIIKRIIIIILTIALATGGYLLNKSRMTLHKINKNSEGSITEIYVVVKSDSDYTDLSSLEDKNIGFQNGVDKNQAAYAKEQIQSELSSINAVEELDYTTLYTNLNLGFIDAFVISDTYYEMSKSNIDNFEDNIKIIHTFEKENDASNASNVDVTEDVFTVYISGIDNMGSPDQQTRTDTNIILIVNPKANHIDMVSLPRDGLMPNAAYQYQNDKLTHTGNDGI